MIGVLLADVADQYARIALANISREFPAGVVHRMTGPGDFPRPRERNPAFYGSYDWHSCVEMHWLLVRLLRVAGDHVPQPEVRAALDEHLAPGPLAAEARFMADPANAAGQRPYGWGWALTLAHELELLGDTDAARWTANLAPLADTITHNFLAWLAKSPYPVRYGSIQTAHSGFPARCRTRPGTIRPWPRHCARPPCAGLAATPTTPAAGNHPATTSSPRP